MPKILAFRFTEQCFVCFDVNEDGFYAIGDKSNTVHVFYSDGNFQYGYHFHTDGTYGIDLNKNSIVIYLGRSGIAVEIDLAGNCIAAEEVYFSKDFIDHVLNRTNKQIGKTYYYLERDIGIFNGDYSRLIKSDEEGNNTVLYDATAKGYVVGILHYVILGIFPIAGIAFVSAKVKEGKRASEESDNNLHEHR